MALGNQSKSWPKAKQRCRKESGNLKEKAASSKLQLKMYKKQIKNFKNKLRLPDKCFKTNK